MATNYKSKIDLDLLSDAANKKFAIVYSRAIEKPVIEVHISNTKSREDYRHKSFISPHVIGIIQGFGLLSYELAIISFINNIRDE